MKILLKQLNLVNFKGQRDLQVEFNEQTTISGDNATGKSTVFDAFTWVLFGKDSQDRTDFDIKTLDENNRVIEKIPHEVEAILLVDDTPVKLKRCYCEKWQRKRGEDVAEFTGHETKYFVNDVEKSQKEYNEEISSICNEQLFKFITNPLYFTSQKKDVQRTMLIQLADDVSDEDIISKQDDFIKLFQSIGGMDLEKFKSEIAAKKKRLKDILETAPIQIEEIKRGLPEVKDWNAINTEIAAKKKEIEDIDNAIADKAKELQQAQEGRAEIQRQIGVKNEQKLKLEQDIRQKSLEGYYGTLRQYNEEKARVEKTHSDHNTTLNNLREQRRQLEAEQQQLVVRKSGIETQLKEARTAWATANDSQIAFNDNDFICPTCKREFDYSDIKAKKEELTANFNTTKANKLEQLQKQGKEFNTALETIESRSKEITELIETLSTKIKEAENTCLQRVPSEPVKPQEPDFLQSKEYADLSKEIEALKSKLNEHAQAVEQTEHKTRKQTLQTEIETLTRELALKEQIERGETRINELSEQIRTNAQELALLEKQEYTILQFSKAKMMAIEEKTNGMFSLVRFKLFETQINGGEVPTCEAMVNGVPFSSLNNAMRINTGLDIINAICNKNEVSAPIFIDNAEAVNELFQTNSQIIRLVVTTDKSLIIK